MRETYWKEGYPGYNRVRYTCDACKVEVGDARMHSDEHRRIAAEYAGMNEGTHECTHCRRQRERAYDRWVLSPR